MFLFFLRILLLALLLRQVYEASDYSPQLNSQSLKLILTNTFSFFLQRRILIQKKVDQARFYQMLGIFNIIEMISFNLYLIKKQGFYELVFSSSYSLIILIDLYLSSSKLEKMYNSYMNEYMHTVGVGIPQRRKYKIEETMKLYSSLLIFNITLRQTCFLHQFKPHCLILFLLSLIHLFMLFRKFYIYLYFLLLFSFELLFSFLNYRYSSTKNMVLVSALTEVDNILVLIVLFFYVYSDYKANN